MTSEPLPNILSLSFSVNRWNHLYSLQQAIDFNQQQNGRSLTITGQIRNHPFLKQSDTQVKIRFTLLKETPIYPECNESGLHILGTMRHSEEQLETEIPVNSDVFEELCKNLMEYGDIDGIHIVVTLGVFSTLDHWPVGDTLNILQLDYAMRGDA